MIGIITSVLLLTLPYPTVFAPRPPVQDQLDSFEAVTARIRAIYASGEWKAQGWKDERFDTYIKAIVDEVNRHGREPKFRVPVTMGEVTTVVPQGVPNPEKVLVVGTEGERMLGSRRKWIILVDGNAQFSTLEDCIVIVRGTAKILRTTRCIVIAGQGVTVTTDGDATKQNPNGSLLISGGFLMVNAAYQSILHAPKEISGTRGEGLLLLNSPNVVEALAKSTETRAIKDAKIGLLPKPQPNPLEGKITITEVIPPGRLNTPRGPGVIIDMKGIERVIRLNQEVTDGNGQPIAELTGWKLKSISIDGSQVQFTKGEQEANFTLKSTAVPQVLPAVAPKVAAPIRIQILPAVPPPMKKDGDK
jgi:hypothetical protein